MLLWILTAEIDLSFSFFFYSENALKGNSLQHTPGHTEALTVSLITIIIIIIIIFRSF